MLRTRLSEIVGAAYAEKRRIVAPLLGMPSIRLIKTNVKLAQQNASEHFKVIKTTFETFSPDIVFPLMDLSVEANALGRYTIIPVNDSAVVPKTDFYPEQITDLKRIDISYDSRVSSSVETLRLMKIGLPDTVLRAAYVIGPYSLAALIMGAEEAAIATLLQPDALHEVCRLANKTIHEYAGMLVSAKADVIVVLEPTAVMLSPVHFQQFSGDYVRVLCESYKGTDIVYHVCGNSMHLINSMAGSGVNGMSVDAREKGVDLVEVAKKVSPDTVVIGNVSTTEALYRGHPEEVRTEVGHLLRSMDGFENFILSTACDIPQETPIENIRSFMEAARSYRIGR